ncbi:hypothetical protein CU048_14010 [Beijerinckiaceae bacterium]|nr:hypothetical protein CU048_14010 [Beijerinckiaceae bacterium]
MTRPCENGLERDPPVQLRSDRGRMYRLPSRRKGAGGQDGWIGVTANTRILDFFPMRIDQLA